jgi:O-antigen ligase
VPGIGGPAGAGLALAAWGLVSVLWAPTAWRAIHASLTLAGVILLALAGSRIAAEDTPEARARLVRCLGGGLALGLLVALSDAASGNLIRAAVRGLDHVPPHLVFGLKPAASVMALLLPLAAALPVGRGWRAAFLLGGVAGLLLLPGDTARIAAIGGVAAVAATAWLGRRVPAALGVVLAAVVLLIPLLLPPALPSLHAGRMPLSAAHRLLIWNFTGQRIAERPLLGWGMESARAVPGGTALVTPAELDHLRISDPALRAPLLTVQHLPLHTHNMPMQIELELGLPGLLLAAAFVLAAGLAASRSRSPAIATGILASAFVTAMLGFGAWQEWWLCAQAFAAALLGAVPLGRAAGPGTS